MTRRITRPILIWLFLLFTTCAPTAIAQNDDSTNIDSTGLVVEAVAGWDGLVDVSKPVPIAFLFNNYSDRIIEGQLFLSNPNTGRESQLGEILISPGSSRRFATVRALPDWYECIATLRFEDKILWQRALPVSTGREFIRGTNFVLFVSEGSRKLTLTNTAADPTQLMALANGEKMVPDKNGRAVECLTLKPWQIPNHPGPMVAARAMVFAEASSAAALNKVQWRAIAEWVCQGGTLFFHQDCTEAIEQLVTVSPLTTGPPTVENNFSIRRMGLGSIYEFDESLFDQGSKAVHDRITQTTAQLPAHHIVDMARSTYAYRYKAGQSEINQLWVVLFFVCYTFLCGIAILLFRKSRRAIATYIVSVVLTTSVLSVALGVMLRTSQGDMEWTTVTHASANGAVQVGNLNVKSSGGRSTTVALYGSNVDLQLIEGSRRHTNNYYYYGWWHNVDGFPLFNWQPLLVNDGDRRAVDVLMRPWGQRSLHATAFDPDVPSIEFELTHKPVRSSGKKQLGKMPNGTFSVKLKNTLNVTLTEVRLVIGVTGNIDDQLILTNSRAPLVTGPSGSGNFVPSDTGRQFIDLYQSWQLPPVSAGESHQSSFPAKFSFDTSSRYNDAHRCPFKDHSSIPMPRISRLGTASAWIIAAIPESPVLNIDEDKNDFTTHTGSHFFVQEIDPQHMPAVTSFFNTEEPKTSNDD